MIIATAGHIDHGKTSLVAALTGIDTDRLPEEKSRGMTIDLGFAYQPLKDGPVMGFVDVPGHERFVRNMLAGVAGIDLALLVIAADDGPMAQTEEHLAILDLLGVADGVVALTKSDLADEAGLDRIEGEIQVLLAGTKLEGAPVFRTSGTTGAGVKELAAHLEATARRHQVRSAQGNFRLAVDRCFNVAGAGLVVTGTAFAGQAGIDDRLVISPAGTPVRVRGIHAQNQRSEVGVAGQRLGVNIAGTGLARAGVHRGDWLISEAVHAPTGRLDCRLRLLRSETRPLRHWAPVHVHLGATEVTGRVAVLEDRKIPPGGEGLAQLVLDREIGALGRDRLILRDASAQRTIGGGWVIDPFGPTRGRARPERLAVLRAMDEVEPKTAMAALLDLMALGLDEEKFRMARNLAPADMDALVDDLGAVRLAVADGNVIFAQAAWDALGRRVVEALTRHHAAAPDLAGLEEQSLRKQVDRKLTPPLFRELLRHWTEAGTVTRVGAQLALPDHQATMSPEDQSLWVRVSDILEVDAFRPPVVHAMAEEIGLTAKDLERFLARAARMGYLYRTAKNRFFLRAAIAELARVAETVAADGADRRLSIADFRGACDVGRNLAVEILEFFDKSGLTARDGDARRIHGQAAQIFPESGSSL